MTILPVAFIAICGYVANLVGQLIKRDKNLNELYNKQAYVNIAVDAIEQVYKEADVKSMKDGFKEGVK